MPCSWGVCRARAPSPRRAPLTRGPRLRRGFTCTWRWRAQAQKRFRERQKTKFAELTSKVEALEARLAGALADKAKSDDRAAILERCLELRGGGAPAAATATGAAPGEVRGCSLM